MGVTVRCMLPQSCKVPPTPSQAPIIVPKPQLLAGPDGCLPVAGPTAGSAGGPSIGKAQTCTFSRARCGWH